MNTLLLTALLMSQTAVQPPEPTPAPESEAAPPAESPSSPEVSVPATPPAEPVAPMPGRPARRASSVPLRDQAPVVSTRRLLGVGVAVTGVVLVMVGALAAGATAALEYSRWPSKPAADQEPRAAMSVVAAGAAAVFLMVGATAFLGGVAAILV